MNYYVVFVWMFVIGFIFKLNWNKLYVYFILYYILEYMNIYVLYKGGNMLILKFEKVFYLLSVS